MLIKSKKSKYFYHILNDSDSPINSFRRYIICWGNLRLSKLLVGGGGGGGGGHPALQHPFILQNCVINDNLEFDKLLRLDVFSY